MNKPRNTSDCLFLVAAWEEDIIGVLTIIEKAINSLSAISQGIVPRCNFFISPSLKTVQAIFWHNNLEKTITISLNQKKQYLQPYMYGTQTIIFMLPNNADSVEVVSAIKEGFKEAETGYEYKVWFCENNGKSDWQELVFYDDCGSWIVAGSR